MRTVPACRAFQDFERRGARRAGNGKANRRVAMACTSTTRRSI